MTLINTIVSENTFQSILTGLFLLSYKIKSQKSEKRNHTDFHVVSFLATLKVYIFFKCYASQSL